MSKTLTAQYRCLECMQRQADCLVGQLAGTLSDPDHLREELRALAGPDALGTPPPLIAAAIYRRAREQSGVPDPYEREKAESTQHALELLPELRRRIESSNDPLLSAVQIAIAGNIIDLGPGREFDLLAQIERAFSIPVHQPTLERLREELAASKQVLYLGDNAGEAVLDRLLMEQIDSQVIYAVRGEPVINDVTEHEALASGIDQVAAILPTGSDIPGIILDECSLEFRRVFEQADVILSKGQGNYESLSGTAKPVYFLLVIKCDLVANNLNRRVGDGVLLAANPV
ncbi:MAG: ARMT1-like domain-containing protein [Anaerolineales bacterium]